MSKDKRMLDIDENLDFCPQCEADLAPYRSVGAMPSFCLQCKFPLMLVADKYRLQKAVGQGAVGTVYLARHIRLNHNAERVVKVIKQELLSNRNTVHRFLREVQVTADLSERNEHIIRIYDDFGEIPHLGYFYVMEYIRGVSMRHYIQKQTQLPTLPWCLSIMGQLCEALQIAHEAGVVHRDLKPDNLMLTEKPNIGTYLKVLDWGIAKPTAIVDENLTQGLVGTPHYMAPEQAMNLEIDARTDLYATAVIMYELLTGINPFVAVTGKKGKSHESMVDLIQAHLYEDPPPINTLTPQRSDVTPAIQAVIFKALEKKPDDRYPDAMTFFRALHEAIVASGVTVEPPKTGLYQIMTPPSQEGLLQGPGSNPASLSNPNLTPSAGPMLSDVASNDPAYPGHFADDSMALKTTLDGELEVNEDGKAQKRKVAASLTASAPKEGGSPIKWLLICLLLTLIGGGATWAFLYLPRTQQPAPSKRGSSLTGKTPSVRTTPSKKGITPRWVSSKKAKADGGPSLAIGTPDAAPNPAPRRALPRRIIPARRKVTRRAPPVRRKRRWRRRRTRRRPPPRPVSPCPDPTMVQVKVSPFVSRRAEVTAEPGSISRVNSKLFCISTKTRNISIIQRGYAPCIFRVPTGRKTLQLQLQGVDNGGELASGCLRTK